MRGQKLSLAAPCSVRNRRHGSPVYMVYPGLWDPFCPLRCPSVRPPSRLVMAPAATLRLPLYKSSTTMPDARAHWRAVTGQAAAARLLSSSTYGRERRAGSRDRRRRRRPTRTSPRRNSAARLPLTAPPARRSHCRRAIVPTAASRRCLCHVSNHADEVDGAIASVSRGVDAGLSLRERRSSVADAGTGSDLTGGRSRRLGPPCLVAAARETA